jgi:hypothetical protein
MIGSCCVSKTSLQSAAWADYKDVSLSLEAHENGRLQKNSIDNFSPDVLPRQNSPLPRCNHILISQSNFPLVGPDVGLSLEAATAALLLTLIPPFVYGADRKYSPRPDNAD